MIIILEKEKYKKIIRKLIIKENNKIIIKMII